ncbi:hypothetical protein Hdeb2414_s0020g00559811 [Helianthus debilis subsp. tardiflorus]
MVCFLMMKQLQLEMQCMSRLISNSETKCQSGYHDIRCKWVAIRMD